MNLWEKCVSFHGHACGGLTIGYKAALYAIDLLGLSFSEDEQIVCVSENDACGVDALVVSGVAGGLDAAARPFDLVIARETAYHDVAEDILTEYHPWMESIWFQSDAALLARAEAAAGTTGVRVHCHAERAVLTILC